MGKISDKEKRMRIGILGGSFDPVHNAHISLAESAAKQLGLDLMIFMPARCAALKDGPPAATCQQRVEMLKIALQSVKFPYEISDIEIKRDGISYSIDTVRELIKIYPDAEIYWIIGSDHLQKLSKWRNIEEFCKLAKFACARRGGFAGDFSDAPECARIEPIDFDPVDISSTSLRRKLKNGDTRNLDISPNVLDYILKNKLYI